MSAGQILKTAAEAAALCTVFSWLFYHSVIPGAVCFLPFYHFYKKRRKKEYFQRRLDILKSDFCDMAESLSASLRTGYSVENAMKKAVLQLESAGKGRGDMAVFLDRMLTDMQVGTSVEEVWEDFSAAVPVEEIRLFGQIFRLSHRCGASLPAVCGRVVLQIGQKIETSREIETILAGKKTEQKVMNWMPALILFNVDLTSPAMMEVMYTTTAGRAVMTAALGVYMTAFLISEKLADSLCS